MLSPAALPGRPRPRFAISQSACERLDMGPVWPKLIPLSHFRASASRSSGVIFRKSLLLVIVF
jgi:hypothetical protein